MRSPGYLRRVVRFDGVSSSDSSPSVSRASLLSTQVYTRVAISKLKAIHGATHPGAKLGRPEGQAGQESEGAPGGGGDGDEAADSPESQ
jgi:hypothetical protein